MIRQRSRLRRTMKWVGLVLCVLTVTAFGVGLRWGIFLETPHGGLGLGAGCLAIIVGADLGSEWGITDLGEITWHAITWWPGRRGSVYPLVVVPLWLPLLVFGLATAVLWWRDRRLPPGHCQTCAYDLTGNESGRCPECGCDVVPSKSRST